MRLRFAWDCERNVARIENLDVFRRNARKFGVKIVELWNRKNYAND